MILKANTAYNIGFTINDSTGLAADADSLPTASVYSNATEIVTSANTTVAKITGEDGCYTASFTTPESVTLGQTVKLLIKATVDTITSKAFKNLGLFGKTVDQLNDINTGAIRTELATELGRIDAAISTRSTYAGGAVASVSAGVTVTTNNDKTGYSLSTNPPTAAQIKTEIEQTGSHLALIKTQTDKISNLFSLITTVADNNPFADEYPSQELSPYFRLTIGAALANVYIGSRIAIYVPAIGGVGSPVVIDRKIVGYGGVDGTAFGNKMYVVLVDEPFGVPFANGTPVVIFAGLQNVAQTGDQMDLITAPNANAIAAFKTAIEAENSYLDLALNGIDSLITRLTEARAGYIDKLNVTGTLANTDNADTFKADLSDIDLSGLTVSVDTAAIITALKASIGWTEGGTWTFEEIVKILTAVAFGNSKDKPGTPGTYQLTDAEDNVTVIAETTLSTTSPYVTTTKI